MKKSYYSEPKFKLPFILSAALHIAVLVALIFAAPVASYRLDASSMTNNRSVVQASVIDSAQVAAQVQAIQSRDAAIAAAQQQKVQQLQAQAQAAQQQKQAEEQRLAQIKADQQKTIQQQQLAAKQVQLEQQRLAQLKVQQEAQAKAQALALKKQQAAVAAKALAEKKQRDLAAAQQKQAELAAKQKALQQQLMQEQLASDQQQVARAQQMQGLIDQYRARILTAIANQWLIPDGTNPAIFCVFTIDVTSAGAVTHAQLIRSSGNPALDRSAETAIYKASPLPVPKDPAVFAPFQHFTLKMTPHDVTH